MKILIDDANISEIKRLYDLYPIDGVTTNPAILSKQNKNPYEVLEEIRNFIKEDDLHVQLVSNTYEQMEKEAEIITKRLGKNTNLKIPAYGQGFKAMRELSKKGYKITATAVYTPMQATLSAKSNADFIAPYINRIDNLGYDGIEIAKVMQNILENNEFKTKLLAASFKNSNQVLRLCEYGIDTLTIAPNIIDNLVNNQEIQKAIDAFTNDFYKITGNNKDMSNC